jgi:hypothetical protein
MARWAGVGSRWARDMNRFSHHLLRANRCFGVKPRRKNSPCRCRAAVSTSTTTLDAPMKNRPARKLVLVLLVQLLLAASTVAAHAPPADDVWPDPKPTLWPDPTPAPMPVVRTVPNFQAPSAAHCAAGSNARVAGHSGRRAVFGRSPRIPRPPVQIGRGRIVRSGAGGRPRAGVARRGRPACRFRPQCAGLADVPIAAAPSAANPFAGPGHRRHGR